MIQKSIMLLNSGKLVIQNDIRNELQSLQGFVCLPVDPHSQNQRPSLNAQHSVDVPSKNLNAPNPIDAAALAVPKRIGSLLAELGPRASSNETILKAVFGIAKEGSSRSSSSSLETLDLNGLFYTLLLVANHEVPDGEVPNSARQETLEECVSASGLTCSVKTITQQFPEIRSISPASSLWSFPRIGAVVKELYGALELDRLAFCLDAPLAVLKGKQALQWLVKVPRAVTNSDLPAGLVYQVWKNPGRACVWETTYRTTARVPAAAHGLR